MKKILVLGIVLLILAVAGCSSSDSGSENQAQTGSQSSETQTGSTSDNQSGGTQTQNNDNGQNQAGDSGQSQGSNGEAGMFQTNVKDPKDIEFKPKQGLKTAKDIKLPFDKAKVKGKKIGIIETGYGNIYIELYAADAPGTVMNFEKLANSGFYDGITFHRVEPGFVVQGGDPEGTGRGGPGYSIKAEINSKKHVKGTVAMARKQIDMDSAGSQFYICLNDQPRLDGKYTVFGQVIEGMNLVEKIAIGDKMNNVTVVNF